MPYLSEHLRIDTNLDAKNEYLALPSSQASGGCPEAPRKVEMALHEGEACDILTELRFAIKQKSALIQDRRDLVTGEKAKTRAQRFIKDAASLVDMYAELYRNAHRAMIALGLSVNDTTFRPLEAKDLATKNAMQHRVIGDGKRDDSWIWRIGPVGNVSEKDRQDWDMECMFNSFL